MAELPLLPQARPELLFAAPGLWAPPHDELFTPHDLYMPLTLPVTLACSIVVPMAPLETPETSVNSHTLVALLTALV
jgi:hypothetical protein